MHPNKKRKPKHTAVFRYHNLDDDIRIGCSKMSKAGSIDYIGESFKCDRYRKYSRAIWQEMRYVYTARRPMERRRIKWEL